MKRLMLACLLFAVACQTKEKTGAAGHEPSGPITTGTVIAADSVAIRDELNELYFSVKLITNEYSKDGHYDLDVLYGYNDASTTITFPRGGTKALTPAIKKGNTPNEFVVGFYYGKDTAFYDYFVVKANKGNTEMRYLKSYSFQ